MRKLLILAVLSIFMTDNIKAQENELPLDPNVRYGKLDNGLTYYIRHNAYPANRANFYIAQKVGSMQEEDSQSGLAHFLEHMAFNGTKHYPGRKTMMDYLEKNGAKFGANVNAYTSFDETVYNLSDIPLTRPTVVDSCLLILHDWSSFITLDNAEIDKERPIIKEEWRTRGSANSRILEKTLPILFKDSKYANRMPIGSMDVVENFDYQTLKDYYHKWYRPDLQGIVIVGDIDVDQVEAKIKEMFADIHLPQIVAERVYYPVPDNDEPIVAIATDKEATRTTVSIYFKHDPLPVEVRKTAQGLYMSYLQNLASDMLSTRFQEIAQKPDAPFVTALAYDDDYIVSKTKKAWTLSALSKEGQVENTLSDLIRENKRVVEYGFTQSEIDRAKANLLEGYKNVYNNRDKQQSSAYVDEYIRSFIDDEPIPGIEYEYDLAQRIVGGISSDAIDKYIRSIVTDKNMVVSVTGPEKEGLSYPTAEELLVTISKAESDTLEAYVDTVSNEPLITNLPQKGTIVSEDKNNKLGSVVWTLSNGMTVAYKKTDFKDDQIMMNSIAYGGTSMYRDNQIFEANMISQVPVIGGLGQFNRTNLTKLLAGKSANVKTSVGYYTQSINGTSSIRDLETLMQLTYLSFTAPRKDEDAYQAYVSRLKDQLKNIRSAPSTIFSDSISSAVYGDNLRTKTMTEQDVDALNYDSIIAMYKQTFSNPGSFVFTFVGSLDPDTLKPLVEQYLASLPAGNVNAMYRDVDYTIRDGFYTNQFLQKMQNPKASVFDLIKGQMKRDQKTVLTVAIVNQLLDIIFTRSIREEEGGTYGVGSNLSIARIPEGRTLLQINFDTDPNKAVSLNQEVYKELRKLASEGPTDVDFTKVKEYMTKKYEQNIKTNGYWSSILNTYYFYGDNDNSDYLRILNSIKPKDVQKFVDKFISQDNLIEVIMVPEM